MSTRTFLACKSEIPHRGVPPDSFLNELCDWAATEDESVFADNDVARDIYAVLKPVLGPWTSILHRRAVMCEALRVLGGFESTWNWLEGRDTSAGPETIDEQEAGIFQVSYNSSNFPTMRKDLEDEGITNAQDFINETKSDHIFALAYCARLLRQSVTWDGPILRGDVSRAVSRDAVAEFQLFLAAPAQ